MANKTILVVDDEKDTVTYFTNVLEDNGFKVIPANNAITCLEVLENQDVDLITLDVAMPEMSGVKCYRSIKEKFSNIPVVIITGIADDFKNFISSRKQVPAPEGYLSKPVNDEELIKLIKSLI